jgi:hypothetical protein
MHTHTVRHLTIGQFDPAMQQTALLELQVRYILIEGMQDRKTRQDGITVMTMVIDHVPPVGRSMPVRFGQELMLWLTGPVGVLLFMAQMQSLHFLQKDNIGIEMTQALAQLMHHHAPVKAGKALVDVERRDMQVGLHLVL